MAIKLERLTYTIMIDLHIKPKDPHYLLYLIDIDIDEIVPIAFNNQQESAEYELFHKPIDMGKYGDIIATSIGETECLRNKLNKWI